MEVEDRLQDNLEMLRRCIIEGNVESSKKVVFECEKKFKLSFNDQRVNYHISAMRNDEFSTALIPREAELKSCIALKTTGNANCMFNAASLLLAGNESLSDVIRLLVAGKVFFFSEFYIQTIQDRFLEVEKETSYSEASISTIVEEEPPARKAVVSTNVTVVDTFSMVIVALVITGVVILVGVSRAHSDDQGAKD
ncbi:unnamed protein product [Porites evermanni]|uniref:Uncharacterized protein n=1 Tax=Porites evermanni TaxID=104178 RepID=A0ABN8MH39_9CNID|nr:unnamed protein product [Porites evermanni]